MSEVHAIEQWRRIPGYPAYEVSNRGNVQSFWQATGWHENRVMVIGEVARDVKRYCPSGRVQVTLGDGKGGQKTFGVAMLVLMAFVRLPDHEEIARHVHDPNPWNLAPENLAWGTYKENRADILRHEGRFAQTKLTAVDVLEILNLIAVGEISQSEIARRKGVSASTITNIKKGRNCFHPIHQDP